MTDHDDRDTLGQPDDELDHQPDDELVSAVLDEEATSEERARVLEDERLRSRLEAFQTVATTLRSSTVVADSPGREHAIGRALASATLTAEGDRSDAPSVDAVRAPTAVRRVAPWLAAAAAVVAVLVPVSLALVRSDGERSQEAATSPESDAGGPTAERQGTAPGAADDSPDAAVDDELSTDQAPPAAQTALGELGSPAELARAGSTLVGTDVAQRSGGFSESAPEEKVDPGTADARLNLSSLATCEEAVRGRDPTLTTVVATAVATYQGSAAFVVVVAEGPEMPPLLVVAVAQAGCRELARSPM
jgi:hypothetical protein